MTPVPPSHGNTQVDSKFNVTTSLTRDLFRVLLWIEKARVLEIQDLNYISWCGWCHIDWCLTIRSYASLSSVMSRHGGGRRTCCVRTCCMRWGDGSIWHMVMKKNCTPYGSCGETPISVLDRLYRFRLQPICQWTDLLKFYESTYNSKGFFVCVYYNK